MSCVDALTRGLGNQGVYHLVSFLLSTIKREGSYAPAGSLHKPQVPL